MSVARITIAEAGSLWVNHCSVVLWTSLKTLNDVWSGKWSCQQSEVVSSNAITAPWLYCSSQCCLCFSHFTSYTFWSTWRNGAQLDKASSMKCNYGNIQGVQRLPNFCSSPLQGLDSLKYWWPMTHFLPYNGRFLYLTETLRISQ